MRTGSLAIAVALALLASPPFARAAVDAPEETPIGGEAVRFESPDGVKLSGNLFKPTKKGSLKGGIVFVHEPFRSSRDWAYMAEKMSRHGFASLVFDLRGHGGSLMRGDEELDREIFMDEDFQAMGQDVAAAVTVLRGQPGMGGLPVHMAGSDLGGSLALLQAIASDDVKTVALLSPGLGYDGVNIVGTASSLSERQMLLVFSSEDSYSRKSTEVLASQTSGPVHVETYYGVGHGTKMLSREPRLEVLLVSWFLGTVITVEGRPLEDTGKPIAEQKSVDGNIDKEAELRRLEEERRSAQEAGSGVVGEDDTGKRWDLDEGEKRKR